MFNQVVLWSVIGPSDAEGRSKVLHRLTGHTVSISQSVCKDIDSFSFHRKRALRANCLFANHQLFFGPVLPEFVPVVKFQGVIFAIQYNSVTSVLCSVSDDRSIIVWKVYFPAAAANHPSWETAQFTQQWRSVSDRFLSRAAESRTITLSSSSSSQTANTQPFPCRATSTLSVKRIGVAEVASRWRLTITQRVEAFY